MKRILLVSPFPPYIGGVSVSTQRLFENLVKDGYRVTKYDIKFKIKKYNKFGILKALRFLWLPIFLLTHPRYDVIHFHISGSFLRIYISIFRLFFSRKTKFISTIHGDAKNLLDAPLGKLCVTGFDSFICVKNGDKNVLAPYFSKEIVEIPAFIPPVETEAYKSLIPSDVLDFINRDTSPIITFNGFILCNENYTDLYGIKTILKAFLKLLEQGVDCRLLILLLGEVNNTKESELKSEIDELILQITKKDKVLITKVCNTEFWPILKESKVFVRPTLTDGDALSIREALWFNIPTIASDVVVRPQGTILYNSRSIDDLVIKIDKCLNMRGSERVLDSESYYESIVNIYN